MFAGATRTNRNPHRRFRDKHLRAFANPSPDRNPRTNADQHPGSYIDSGANSNTSPNSYAPAHHYSRTRSAANTSAASTHVPASPGHPHNCT